MITRISQVVFFLAFGLTLFLGSLMIVAQIAALVAGLAMILEK